MQQVGQNTENDMPIPRKNSSESAEEYYDSQDAFKYYSTISHPDFNGLGLYPSEVQETDVDDPEGPKYIRGDGITVVEATHQRDKRMLEAILKYTKSDKKLKCLELGSGRGGLTRFIAMELLKLDRLELMVGSNISNVENEYNLKRAKELNISSSVYEVKHMSFDEINFPDETFDLVFSNDSMLHSANKSKLLDDISRILKKDGVLLFSDIIENSKADKSDLQGIYQRLDLEQLFTIEMIENTLQEKGLTKLESYTDTKNLIRHYGMTKYNVQVAKRDILVNEHKISLDFLERQNVGLKKWLDCASKNLIMWGWFIFKK